MQSNPESSDFQKELNEILKIVGVSKKKIADWAGVEPSTVTRWCHGTHPSDPNGVLNRLRPHVERAREAWHLHLGSNVEKARDRR